MLLTCISFLTQKEDAKTSEKKGVGVQLKQTACQGPEAPGPCSPDGGNITPNVFDASQVGIMV